LIINDVRKNVSALAEIKRRDEDKEYEKSEID
jgi:hypothetical protein